MSNEVKTAQQVPVFIPLPQQGMPFVKISLNGITVECAAPTIELALGATEAIIAKIKHNQPDYDYVR